MWECVTMCACVSLYDMCECIERVCELEYNCEWEVMWLCEFAYVVSSLWWMCVWSKFSIVTFSWESSFPPYPYLSFSSFFAPSLSLLLSLSSSPSPSSCYHAPGKTAPFLLPLLPSTHTPGTQWEKQTYESSSASVWGSQIVFEEGRCVIHSDPWVIACMIFSSVSGLDLGCG